MLYNSSFVGEESENLIIFYEEKDFPNFIGKRYEDLKLI